MSRRPAAMATQEKINAKAMESVNEARTVQLIREGMAENTATFRNEGAQLLEQMKGIVGAANVNFDERAANCSIRCPGGGVGIIIRQWVVMGQCGSPAIIDAVA